VKGRHVSSYIKIHSCLKIGLTRFNPNIFTETGKYLQWLLVIQFCNIIALVLIFLIKLIVCVYIQTNRKIIYIVTEAEVSVSLHKIPAPQEPATEYSIAGLRQITLLEIVIGLS